MPLLRPTPPAASLAALSQYLPRLNKATRGLVPERFAEAAGGGPVPPQARLPHRLFTLDMNAITGGRGLDAARESAWRYLVDEGSKVVAAEVQIVDQQHRFGQLNDGPFVAQIPDAVSRFEADPRVLQHDYELRAVVVNPLFVFALWLHAGASVDLVMPLPPVNHQFEAYRIYEEPAFMDGLRLAADERRKFGVEPTRG